VIGLGITWILDGLEVTIVGSLGPALQSTSTLSLSSANLGAVASFYVAGAVVRALIFGWITDRYGRRLVFYVTLMVYLSGVLLSAFAWNFWSFATFRMLTGLGIGGGYAAVNSAIDELIPAKYRGRVDLIVNGSFCLGAAAGSLAVPFLWDQRLFAPDIGWRLGFGIGAVLGLGILLLLRRFVPESPRWLVTHGRNEQAEKTVSEIELDVAKATGQHPPVPKESIEVHPRKVFGIGLILSSMLGQYRKRSIFGACSDGGSVLSLQLRVLHVRLGPVSFLPGSKRTHRPLSPAACSRQFLRSPFSRLVIRCGRSQGHDSGNVWDQRVTPAFNRLPLCCRIPHSGHTNRRLVFNLFLRVSGGELGLI
jgi:MFS family permease